MAKNRNRSWVAAAACSLALVAVVAGCSSTDEAVTSTGAPQSQGTSRPGGTGSTVPSGLQATAKTAPATQAPTTPLSAPPTVATQEGAPVVPSGSPETTIPDPNTTLAPPDPTVVPTIPATGDDPVLINCGTVYRANGWPTTIPIRPDAFTCLADAFAAGTPARLVDREQTDGYGGAILITTYDALGPGDLRMTVDARNAADRPQVVTVSRCTGVVADGIRLVVSGCTVTG